MEPELEPASDPQWTASFFVNLPFEATDINVATDKARSEFENLILKYVPKENLEKFQFNVMLKRRKQSGTFKNKLINISLTPAEAVDQALTLGVVEVEGQTYQLNASSRRYMCYKRDGYACCACGLVATVVKLCPEPTKPSHAHFVLYGIENREHVLFTKDHIIPKSKNGTNLLDNLQTFCFKCNQSKGDKLISNSEVVKLRENFKYRSEKLVERHLESETVELAGIKLKRKNSKERADSLVKNRFLFTNTDLLMIWDRMAKRHHAHSVSNKVVTDETNHLGQFKRLKLPINTVVLPRGRVNSVLFCHVPVGSLVYKCTFEPHLLETSIFGDITENNVLELPVLT